MQVSYVFFSGVSQQHFDAAQAVCDAMEQAGVGVLAAKEQLGGDAMLKFIAEQAAAILGDGWDAESVVAMTEGCIFVVEHGESVAQ